MAHDDDAENQANIESSEETPLLRDPEDTDEETDQKHEQKPASWYLWRIFWVILAALILALFIKGWIDAGGDVDVRSINPQWLSQLTFVLQFDLKKALKRALGGGLSGAAAMVLQVLLLMVRNSSFSSSKLCLSHPPAAPNYHELSIPVRDFLYRRQQDALPRRIWAILSRSWTSTHPRQGFNAIYDPVIRS